MSKEYLFALDIGTRNVVGIVAAPVGDKLEILASERLEHKTRAMLDGQIHDIPQVVVVIKEIKEKLEAKLGCTLTEATIAAAGRALLTLEANADMELTSPAAITTEVEQALEVLAIQNAQQVLGENASTGTQSYYCVGYSVNNYCLDGSNLTTLVGQRGKQAAIQLIATFLPKQVVDSLETALIQSGLQMASITLEPIAAINVLIPPTMRHLNIALVDIGAGTSDIAITAGGSVIGFGMVPCAGDEITETLSQNYLLDFNDAEQIKRKLNGKVKKITVTDVLGYSKKLDVLEIIRGITPTVIDLADKITQEILRLNGKVPQAVILIGGGALTTQLTNFIAEKLEMDLDKIGIRQPVAGANFIAIPADLMTPEAITPLGILKLANSNYLNFITVTINNQLHRIFNLGILTVADALLAIGLDIKTMKGRPGLGIAITVNGERRFIGGSHGSDGRITINGEGGDLKSELHEGDEVTIVKGETGTAPIIRLGELCRDEKSTIPLIINEVQMLLQPIVTVNGVEVDFEYQLLDNDDVLISRISTIKELLSLPQMQDYSKTYTYYINQEEVKYTCIPKVAINEQAVDIRSSVTDYDKITLTPTPMPTLAEILAINPRQQESISVKFCGQPVEINKYFIVHEVNGQSAELTDIPPADCHIKYVKTIKKIIVSDVLEASDFNPRDISADKKVDIYLNNQLTSFIEHIKNGDEVSVIISDR